jgi:outer membrane protein assembly factor BamE (lipoprotein component of BamABCDE complex)
MSHENHGTQAGRWARSALSAFVLLTAAGLARADGFIKSPELLDKIRAGETTSQQVMEILGKPARVEKFPRRQVEAWGYRMQEWGKPVEISVEIDGKGVVSNVEKLVRWGP